MRLLGLKLTSILAVILGSVWANLRTPFDTLDVGQRWRVGALVVVFLALGSRS